MNRIGFLNSYFLKYRDNLKTFFIGTRSSLLKSRPKKHKNLRASTSEESISLECRNSDESEADLRQTKTKTPGPALIPLKEVDKHLKNIREVLLNSNATPIRCYSGKGYACNYCSSQYLDPAELKEHTINKHDDKEKKEFKTGKDMHGYFVKLDITGLKCNLCDEEIDTLETLMPHLSEIHKVFLYLDIKNHILPFKFDSESIYCFMCSNVFNTFKALLEHVNVHYRNYVCEVCDAGFVNKNILLRHGYAHKTGTYACAHCSQVFDTARKREFHVRSKHLNYFPHKCAYCSERFKEIWKKKNHMKQAHNIKGPGVKCKACEKQFATKQGWRLHTSRVHLMLRNYKCSDCDMEFHTKQELALHGVKHTGTREFRCDVCFKKYGRYKTLKDHKRRTHPETPV